MHREAGVGGDGMAEDAFERVPDSVVVVILNRVGDIKALGRCCVASKRFSALVPQVDNVVVKVDCVISGEESSSLNAKGKGVLSHLVRFVVGSIVKPLQHLLAPRRSALAEVSHHSPSEVLRNFREIRSLRIELPGGELGIEDGVVLKWKAEFGSTLHSCVILGASSMATAAEPPPDDDDDDGDGDGDGGTIPESFYTNGGLKLRVVWTISSLIAASARHYLLQQIISDHPTLRTLVLTDSDAQGVLCMGTDQLQELREKPLAPSASSNRTQVPALNMKLWYAPHLDLPGGTTLHGATLVAIRPTHPTPCKHPDALLAAAFDEPFNTAAALLARRRTYLLEMNSF